MIELFHCRIEELAKKMMSKVDEEMAAKKSLERKRHPSEPTPRFNSIETILLFINSIYNLYLLWECKSVVCN